MPGYLPLMALWLMAGGAPQGWSPAELMAAAKPAGEARTGLRVVSAHPVGVAIVQIDSHR
jgi:hypothetical protein